MFKKVIQSKMCIILFPFVIGILRESKHSLDYKKCHACQHHWYDEIILLFLSMNNEV